MSKSVRPEQAAGALGMARSETSDARFLPPALKAVEPWRRRRSVCRDEQVPEAVESALSDSVVHRDSVVRFAPRCFAGGRLAGGDFD